MHGLQVFSFEASECLVPVNPTTLGGDPSYIITVANPKGDKCKGPDNYSPPKFCPEP